MYGSDGARGEGDPAARAKLFQFEEELRLLGYEDVKKKLVKKELER